MLYDEKAVPRVPVYVDSPLATRLTRVYGEHPEVYDADTHTTFLEKGKNPFLFNQLKFVGSVQESMEINRRRQPQIVLAASGMCEGGRILHHLRHKIHSSENTILLVGYMARNTLGRRIEEEGLAFTANGRRGNPPLLRILGKEYPLYAKVDKIAGFSAHADRGELLRFVTESNLNIKQIALIHGEEEQSLSLAEALGAKGLLVRVPRRGEIMRLD